MALDNYNILKCMSREELIELVPPEFSFYTDPWDHQIASFIACIANNAFIMALDLGTGKTKVSIDLCRYIQSVVGVNINGIVVCQNNAVEKWVEEIQTHSSELTGVAIRGADERDGPWYEKGSRVTRKAKEVKFDLLCDTSYNLRVVSFESFRSMCTERVQVEGKKNRKEVTDLRKLKAIVRTRPNMLIIDESHKIKNPKALIYQICEMISREVQYKYLLTGTPFNKLLDLWTQYFIIDRGETFGSNYYQFRRDNFEEKTKYLRSRGIQISDWKVTEEGKKFITSRMYSKAIRYSEDEVKGMPGKVFERIQYRLSKEQEKDYLDLLAGSERMRGSFDNASMTFRQICSGFIIKTGKKYKSNPKLLALMETLEPIVEENKVVIFHYFQQEYRDIEAALKKAKIKYCAINGLIKDKYKQNKLFLDDPKYRVMIANLKSGSESIDLQSARYAFFYSNDHSVITRKQAIKRIHRGAIKRTRFYYDMVAKDTVENSMYWAMKQGVNLFDEVMDGQSFRDMLLGKVSDGKA